MYYLPVGFPAARRLQLPITRDQTVLLLVAVNLLLLGVETYLAHLISGTIVLREWIPVLFGPIGGVLLLIAGALAVKKRRLSVTLASTVFVASIAVGLLGAYFHTVRAIMPSAEFGEQVSISLLVWAPPILGPLTFSLVGLIGLLAALLEHPADSGTYHLVGGKTVQLPYSETRVLLFLVSLGCLATLLSSVYDHARTDFSNPWLWLATGIGVFGTVVAMLLGNSDEPASSEVRTYVAAMILMIIVGAVGFALHIAHNLTTEWEVVIERFIRGAPPLAPFLFSDIGLIGIAVLLDPKERDRG